MVIELRLTLEERSCQKGSRHVPVEARKYLKQKGNKVIGGGRKDKDGMDSYVFGR